MKDEISPVDDRAAELGAVAQLAQSLCGVQNVSAALAHIAEWSTQHCRADCAAVVLLKHVRGTSIVTVARDTHAPQDVIDHGINAVVTGWVSTHRSELHADDVVRAMNILTPSDNQKRFGAVLAVPLMLEQDVIGVLNMVNLRSRAPFSNEAKGIALSAAPLVAQFLERARLYEQLVYDNALLRSSQTRGGGQHWIPSSHPAMEDLMDRLTRTAPTDATVLITGETGTGKELIARLVHLMGPRSQRPFVAVNCSAIPVALAESELFGHERGAFTGADALYRGKLELAENGTLLLDEIAAMPLDLQPKLLRVLEDRRFNRIGSNVELYLDARIIAATNRDLGMMVKRGEFRDDLYHRLNVVPLHLPPLRERSSDIPVLAQAFLQELSVGQKCFDDGALATLASFEWRGNIRELRNAVESVAVLSAQSVVGEPDLRRILSRSVDAGPEGIAPVLNALIDEKKDAANILDTIEEQLVRCALARTHGNITHAADLLGIERTAMRRRVDKYSGMKKPKH